MKLSACFLALATAALGGNNAEHACASTRCTYSSGTTTVFEKQHKLKENWHCEKVGAGCVCKCHDSYLCTLKHHHVSGYKKAMDHCKAKTASPTSSPTPSPTAFPTANPTAFPTANPTAFPTANPTAFPTANPTANPTAFPTAFPTAAPTPLGNNLCAGQTTFSQWRKYGNSGIYVDVDTSACGLTEAHPAYVTSVAGTSSHWTSVGSSAVYSATKTGFRLYLGKCGDSKCITYAKSYGWVVNWVADKSGKNSGCGSTTSWKKYSSTGLYTDTSTASAGFSKTPAYVTSIHGTSSHWTLRGPHSIYSPTKTGFRTYVYGNNDPNFARKYHWKMCWIGTTDSSFSAQSNPKNWIAYGDHGRTDTSLAGITKRAGYKNIYVTSQIGDTSHWMTYGAGSIYPDGSGNLRTYIYGLSAAFMNQYNHRVNAVVGFQEM